MSQRQLALEDRSPRKGPLNRRSGRKSGAETGSRNPGHWRHLGINPDSARSFRPLLNIAMRLA